MTEAEWMACDLPESMLKFLGDQASERKLRLFGCSCIERIRPLLTDAQSIAALVATDKFIEGSISAEDLEVASYAAHVATEEIHSSAYQAERADSIAKGLLSEMDETFGIWEYASLVSAPAGAAHYISYPSGENFLWAVEQVVSCVAASAGHVAEPMFSGTFDVEHREAVIRGERAKLTALLRDIFGNPFRPITFSLVWRTDTAIALARQMYESREFSAMPILADALQDAGCDNDDILSHCRGEGPHVRGCWVVDLVLGKE